jgi:hypothetical protein
VTAVEGDFGERTAQPKPRSVPLAHLSVELGHLYMEDLLSGTERLVTLLEETRPWVEAATATTQRRLENKRARVSTCFLVDDYFSDLRSPKELVPSLLEAAQSADVVVDYLVRESACAAATGPAGEVSPAELLIARLVAEPPPGTTGGRPPATKSGWLANGRRSSHDGAPAAAMKVAPAWSPPVQTAKRRHSIFVDVEMWDEPEEKRTWSCALLAAVWQMLRLGMLRADGEPLVEPASPPSEWPDVWAELPPVVQLNPRAAPFTAYATMSVLSPRFLPIELAARTIIGQVFVDPAVAAQLAGRAGREGIDLSDDPLDRISYAFTGSGTVDAY